MTSVSNNLYSDYNRLVKNAFILQALRRQTKNEPPVGLVHVFIKMQSYSFGFFRHFYDVTDFKRSMIGSMIEPRSSV